MLTVDDVMSTVRSRISCGSSVNPKDELLQSIAGSVDYACLLHSLSYKAHNIGHCASLGTE